MNITAVSSAITPDPAAKEHHKLVDAAQQFEGIFLSELLKPMARAGSALGDDTEQQEPDTMQSFGMQSLARSIASAGGFGIAAQVVKDVEAHASRTAATQNSETGLKLSEGAPI